MNLNPGEMLATFVATFAANWLRDHVTRRELRALSAWCGELAVRVRFRPPPKIQE